MTFVPRVECSVCGHSIACDAGISRDTVSCPDCKAVLFLVSCGGKVYVERHEKTWYTLAWVAEAYAKRQFAYAEWLRNIARDMPDLRPSESYEAGTVSSKFANEKATQCVFREVNGDVLVYPYVEVLGRCVGTIPESFLVGRVEDGVVTLRNGCMDDLAAAGINDMVLLLVANYEKKRQEERYNELRDEMARMRAMWELRK